jgi:cytoskeletal protein RodZ
MVHVGEKFREERVKRGYTLEEIAKATKIRLSFLSAIEKGEYGKLPSGTYAHGFVKNYARFLKLPENEFLALFKREYNEDQFINVLPEGLIKKNNFPLGKIKFAQTFTIIILIFIALIAYILFQYRSAIFSPSLSVYSPKENSVISSRSIVVIGKTDPNTTVYINSELVALEKDGSFKKTISVFPGRTKITIKSVNNFKRVTVLERNIEIKI